VKKFLITFMCNSSYNDPDKLVNDLESAMTMTFLTFSLLSHSNSMQFKNIELSSLGTMFTHLNVYNLEVNRLVLWDSRYQYSTCTVIIYPVVDKAGWWLGF